MSSDSRPPVPRRSITGVVLLTAVFTVLKLTRVTAWPWWQVLAPLWIAAAVVLATLFALAVAWVYRR